MKVLFRILLAIVVLCLLCGLFAILSTFTAIPWLTTFVGEMMARYSWLPLAFSIVLLFFIAAALLALILIVSVPSKHKLFVVHKDMGNIEITKQSIESSIGNTLDNIHEIKRYHVQVKGSPQPKKLKVDVQAEPRGGNVNLSAIGDEVQQRIRQDLSACLAIEPKHIKVRFQPVHQTQQETRQHTKVPRVV